MKKLIKYATVVFLFAMLLNVCTLKAEAASKPLVRVSKYRMTMYEGAEVQIKQTGSAKKYTWWSNNPKVASVSSKGIIKAKRKGTATIVLKSGNKKSRCIVTVNAKKTTKQLVNTLENQIRNAKNLSVSMYSGKIKYPNLVMRVSVNTSNKVQYVYLAGFGVYSTADKIYWRDPETKKWYYQKNEEEIEDYFDLEDEMFSEDAKIKLVENRTFNKVKCATLKVVEDGMVAYYYFDLRDYSLIGYEEEGDDIDRTIYTYDLKSTVKVPDSIVKFAKYKSFDEY